MATLASEQGKAVSLGQEPPFMLGQMQVVPALRQVSWADQSRILEPRVMQVLVALGRDPGAIVSRDTLVERCWNGRIVGENAIQRPISLLRHLAEESAAFTIETIKKVGYRLLIAPVADRTQPYAAPDGPSRPDRRAVLGGAATLAMLAAGGVFWWRDSPWSPRAEARQLHAAGIELQRRGDNANLHQAANYFERAVAADPSFAEGWGDLARVRLDMFAFLDERSHGGAAVQVAFAAERALRLDPNNRSALLALALYKPHFRRWEAVEARLRSTIKRLPDETLLQVRLGQLQADTGRWRAASASFSRLAERQPLVPDHQLGLARCCKELGDPARAERIFRSVVASASTSPNAWLALFNFLLLHGQAGEAFTMASRPAVGLGGLNPLPEAVAVDTAKALTTRAQSDTRTAVETILAARRRGSLASFLAIPYLVALGRMAEAWELVDAYYFGAKDEASGQRKLLPTLAWRRTDILFTAAARPLRSEPRFAHVTAVLGLDRYWLATGLIPDLR